MAEKNKSNIDGSVPSQSEVLKRIFYLSPDLIGMGSMDGYFTKINSSFKKILGYNDKEFLSKPFIEFVHEDDTEKTIAALGEAANGKSEIFIQNRYKCKDGSYIWIEWKVLILLDENVWYTIGRDITERKKYEEELKKAHGLLEVKVRERTAELSEVNKILRKDIIERQQTEEKLKKSEEKYRLITDSTSDFIAITAFDLKATFLYVSPSYKNILGYSSEELVGTSGFDFVHPDDKMGLLSLLKKYLVEKTKNLLTRNDNPITEMVEFRVKNKSGKWHYLECTANIINNKMLFVSKDITERKQAEDKLQTESNKVTTILELMVDGAYIVNKDYDIEYVNPVIKNNFGSVEGKKCYKYFHESNEPCIFCKNKDVLAGKTVQWQWTSPKNNKVYDLTDMPLKNPDGSISKIEIFHDITERKLAEGTLRENENQFRTLMEQSPYAIQIHDTNGVMLRVNKAWGKLWNIPNHAELLGIYNVLEDPQAIEMGLDKFIKRALNGETVIVPEMTYDPKVSGQPGRKRIISSLVYPLMDKDNKIKNFVITHEDITDKKLAEEALENSRTFLNSTIEQSPFPTWISDANGTMIKANPALLRTLNVSAEQLVGKYNVFEDPQVKEQGIHPKLHNVLNNGVTEEFELAWSGKDTGDPGLQDANYVYCEGTIFPIRDQQGRITHAVITYKDVSDRKQAEEALRHSEEKFKKYVSSAPDGIFIINSKAKFVEVNNTACKITGYSESELLKLSPLDVLDQEYIEKFKTDFNILVEKGGFQGEYKVITKSGKHIWVSINAVVISKDKVMAFCSDITETKRLQELEARAGRLETAGTIAGQVAHDFNNLLAPLIAYPDFIRDELPKNHPSLSYLDQMEKAADKIANINQDLLAMGRRGHYNQEIINLNTIAQQAVAEIDPLPKTLAFELDLCEDLMDIRGGSAQLHRVISNMLHNAQDAMQNIGQVTIKTENYYVDDVSVLYSRVPKGEYVKLTISDTGCGIPDDIIQKIFDPFFTSKTTDKKRGSGLGMSVVDAVIKDHKGYIDLVTKVGKGTSFYIYFPITRKSKNVEQTIDILGGNESVLIVDDDEVQRHVSSQILTKLSYQITSVDSGEKAIELIKNKIFELVILDMIMPNGIDGAETYRKILEISPGQKAIIVSGFSESDRVIEAQKLGVGVFVQKPLTKEAIASAVRNELDKKNEIAIG